MFKTVSHIGAAKPVRMTTKIFCLFPGLDVQDGISHRGGEAGSLMPRELCAKPPRDTRSSGSGTNLVSEVLWGEVVIGFD